uniref:Odorant receptor n=1 Tax=Propsilocerus akamusi TaxID=903466 RepID=A0A7D0P9T3_9DIPT|nr:odorant receptor 15 [Propsilocerus akamusi]
MTIDFDTLLPFRIPVRILKTFGLWLTKEANWIYWLFSIINQLVMIELFTFLQFVYLFTFQTFEDFANLMSLLPTFCSIVVKSLNLCYNVNEIQTLMSSLHDLFEFCTTTENLKLRIIEIDRIFKIFWSSALLTCFLGALVPFTVHELPYKMWFPYDTSNFYLFWLSASYQIIVTFCISAVDIVMDSLPVMFMSYAVGALEELKHRLASLEKHKQLNVDGSINRNKVDNLKQFLKIIEMQRTINNFIKRIERIFSTVLLAQGLMSTLIFCTTAFSLSIVQDLAFFGKLFSYLIPMLFKSFLPCYYGTLVVSISLDLSQSLFSSDWIYEDRHFKKAMLIFIENGKKPMQISAIGIFKVNLATFTRICNSAYSLFAVLKRVNQY